MARGSALLPCLRGAVAHLASLRVLLVVTFIVLMVVSGFLGYFLTYRQSQDSLLEVWNSSSELSGFQAPPLPHWGLLALYPRFGNAHKCKLGSVLRPSVRVGFVNHAQPRGAMQL